MPNSASQALEFIFCNSVLHRNRDKFKEKLFWSKDSTNYQNIYYSLNTNISERKSASKRDVQSIRIASYQNISISTELGRFYHFLSFRQ